jgi:hypothetical protein
MAKFAKPQTPSSRHDNGLSDVVGESARCIAPLFAGKIDSPARRQSHTNLMKSSPTDHQLSLFQLGFFRALGLF